MSKKTISIIVLLSLLVLQVAWMNPYDNPYNQIQYVQEFRAIELEAPTPVDYTGDRDFQTRVNQYNFTDVSGNSKIAAVQLAVFDISKGIGNRRFAAATPIKNIEVITMLVRMFGNDEQIRQTVIANNPGAPASTLTLALYDGYYQEAKRLGILGPLEDVGYTQNATRENIGVWLVKAAGIQSVFSQNGLYKAVDWKDLRTENLPAIETLVDLRILPLQASNRFNPFGSMTRGDFAVVLDRVFEQFSETLGITTQYGILVGNQTSTDPTGTQRDFYIRNIDDTLSHVQVTTPRVGMSTGLVVYKNGLNNHTALRLGDELKYMIKDGVVRYVVVLPTGQVKDRLLQHFKSLTDTELRQGIIQSVNAETLNIGPINQSNVRIRIENDDDSMVDLVSIKDNVMNVENEFLIIDGTRYVKPADLKEKDRLTYVIQGDKILYASLGKSEIQDIRGTLRFVDQISNPPQIVIFDESNRLRIFGVARDASFSVNFYPATLNDLKLGAPTVIRVLNNEIVHLMSDSYQPMPGFIPKDGKIRLATVQSVLGTRLVLKDDKTLYEVGPSTAIYKGTTLVSASTIKNGDRVKLYFDNIYSTVPTRVIIEGPQQLITKTLKGNLFTYNQSTQTVSISERSYLQNTLWVKEQKPATEQYKLALNAKISSNGEPVTLSELGRNFSGRQGYFVIRDNFGSKEIVQMAFHSGFERNYKEAVQSFSNVLNRLVLKNNRTIHYDDTTLFIQDQRVVDKSVLKNNVTVHAVTSFTNGVEKAQIIRVMGNFDTIFDSVYIGALEEVHSYSIRLANYTTVSDYNWKKAHSTQNLLTTSDDTWIYDGTLGEQISREVFFNSAYSRSENDSVDGRGLQKERYYGVFVTDGFDHVLAMRLRFKELIRNENIDDVLTQETQIAARIDAVMSEARFTVGTIGEFNQQWKRVGLVDSQNYLSHHGEWVNNTTLTYIELTDAIIMKNNKAITYDDLKLDDKLYIVRYDEDALVVFVEP